MWRVVGSTSDSSWHITCVEPLLEVLWLRLHLNNSLHDAWPGQTGTEINCDKKVQKKDLKSIKNVIRCRDGMPKSM